MHAPGDSKPLGHVQPEADQRADEAARAAPAPLDGEDFARDDVRADEEHVQDAQLAAGLDPLERSDEVPLEACARPEPIHEELDRRPHGRTTQRKPMSDVEVSMVSP